MSSGDDLLERLDNARTAHGNTPLDALWADAADRIRALQAQVRFLERKAVESAKKA